MRSAMSSWESARKNQGPFIKHNKQDWKSTVITTRGRFAAHRRQARLPQVQRMAEGW